MPANILGLARYAALPWWQTASRSVEAGVCLKLQQHGRFNLSLGSKSDDRLYSDSTQGPTGATGRDVLLLIVPQRADCHDGDSASTARGSNRSASGHAQEGSSSTVYVCHDLPRPHLPCFAEHYMRTVQLHEVEINGVCTGNSSEAMGNVCKCCVVMDSTRHS